MTLQLSEKNLSDCVSIRYQSTALAERCSTISLSSSCSNRLDGVKCGYQNKFLLLFGGNPCGNPPAYSRFDPISKRCERFSAVLSACGGVTAGSLRARSFRWTWIWIPDVHAPLRFRVYGGGVATSNQGDVRGDHLEWTHADHQEDHQDVKAVRSSTAAIASPDELAKGKRLLVLEVFVFPGPCIL